MDNKANQSPLIKVLHTLKPTCIYVAVFSLFMNLLMLTIPLYMLQLFDRVLPGHSYNTLLYLTLMAVIALSVLTALDVIRSYIGIKVGTFFEQSLSPLAFALSSDEVLKGRTYSSQSLNDISTIRQFISSSSLFTFLDTPWMPIYLFVIYLLHVSLGIVATVGAVLLFILALLNEFYTHRLSKKASLHSIKVQYNTDATIRNAESIQAMGMMRSIVNKWQRDNQNVLDAQSAVNHRSALILAMSKGLRMMLQMLILGVGAYYAINNAITPGVMIAASILMGRALAPVEQALSAWKQMQRAREAYDRLQIYFMNLPPEGETSLELPKPIGELTFESVYFVPPQAKKPTLTDINLKIMPGKCVGVIGPCSAGKSSLARLMVGAWKAYSGDVRLDGACIYNWDREHLGQYIGYLPQGIELFNGTVKQNIARMGEIDDQEVIEAAELALVHDLILRLPQGYDTEIGTGAHILSEGQKQRIALARALYKKPVLLVLDEPNAHLDNRGELALIRALEHMKKINTTIIIITHHPSVLKVVDEVIILRDGQVELFGNKAEVFEAMQQQAIKQRESEATTATSPQAPPPSAHNRDNFATHQPKEADL